MAEKRLKSASHLFFLLPTSPTFPSSITKTTRIQDQPRARSGARKTHAAIKSNSQLQHQIEPPPRSSCRRSPIPVVVCLLPLPPPPPPAAAMIIKTLKARILRALKSPLLTSDADSPPPSPTKPGARGGGIASFHADSFSDDASFFDAREAETPTKSHRHPSSEPLDAWELVDQDGRAVPAADLDPLLDFPARCPPGGESMVVLYTTTLRGVRRTFEDCNVVRSLLENLAVAFQERDVSMDRGLRDQLWAVTGEKAVPPRLFVRGHDVGGAAQVLALHEEGRLVSLLPPPADDGGKKAPAKNRKCEACGGLSFVVCGECDGSRKVFDGGRGGGKRCRGCNENGLVMCPICL